MSEFDDRLAALDTGLFSKVEAQLADDDKRALLALQRTVRRGRDHYCYLEIGSYLGGSIQPYLLDPLCSTIVSIDKRPDAVADDRSAKLNLSGISTKRMLDNLKQVSETGLGKIQTFDSDASEVALSSLREAPDICFIDGEHTNDAVVSDFNFCLSVISRPGVICFHDSDVIFPGLSLIVGRLEATKFRFAAYALPRSIFVIELNDAQMHKDPYITEMLINNHRAYLPVLLEMRFYRDFFNSFSMRVMRGAIRPLRRLWRTMRIKDS